MDPNNVLCLRPYRQANIPQPNELKAPTFLVTKFRHGLHRKHRSSVAVQLLLIKNLLSSSGRCLGICFTVIA
jgi:hypothetical protein